MSQPSGRPVVIAATIVAAILIFHVDVSRLPTASRRVIQFTLILYGVALTGIGMLTLTGNNVAMDSFGPISDNANGIGEMAGLDKQGAADHGRPGRCGQHDEGDHQRHRHRLGCHCCGVTLRFIPDRRNQSATGRQYRGHGGWAGAALPGNLCGHRHRVSRCHRSS
jgi:hypothetical protein